MTGFTHDAAARIAKTTMVFVRDRRLNKVGISVSEARDGPVRGIIPGLPEARGFQQLFQAE